MEFEDELYEELDMNRLSELDNSDSLEQYYQDYVSFERDLTQLIKERK